ncbi:MULTISPECIES: hypothetical protein [unclassified Mesorhizobium]|uniref:hypothetical protein n=1 Tax=unclassified Mesorhizobium TaxID=325217 RepID=UPI001D034DB9|nr:MULTISPECIES: hypothetical protein [unclassified Mesorhizobium]UCI28216.1 hypothetical protein FJ430_11700 [Mesorhizobium sp. B2-8-5]
MAKGNINIGDEVAIMATVRRRVTRGSRQRRNPWLQPAAFDPRPDIEGQQGSADRAGGDVTHVDGAKVTVNLGIRVTVDAEIVTLKTRYVPPKRKAPLIDKAS